MRLKNLTATACAMLVLWGSSAFALTMEQWAEKYGIRTDASYDATRVMESKDGTFEFKERKAPGKSAMEMNMGGMQGTAIIREDLKKAWFIMPSMGMYREMDMRDAMKQQTEAMQVSKVEEVGRETVNGFSSRKFKTQFKDQNGKGAGFMWITDDGVPIKMDMIYKNRGMKGQRMKMELKDLQLRAQDASHFELPAGVKPMSLGSIMQGMRQSQDATGRNTHANQDPRSQSASTPQQPPTFGEELGEAAKDEAQDSVVDETRSAVREGIRGLFRR